ncbi:hypothetical protein ANTRET_LOCUS7973 [Anthophora retusa]
MKKKPAPTVLHLTYGARDKRADCARLGSGCDHGSKAEWNGPKWKVGARGVKTPSFGPRRFQTRLEHPQYNTNRSAPAPTSQWQSMESGASQVPVSPWQNMEATTSHPRTSK